MKILDVDYFTRPDYFFSAQYPYMSIKNIYNTILIPMDNIDDYKHILNDRKINIYDHKQKIYPQSIVFDNKTINILNKQYLAIHIAPGFDFDPAARFQLSIKNGNNNHKLEQFLTNSNTIKLIIGLAILNDNYYIRFKKNDRIIIRCNDSIKYGRAISVLNKYNYYSGNMINTIIDLTSTDNYDALFCINCLKNFGSKKYIVSQDTRSNNQKGSICLNIKNSKDYVAICKDTNDKIIDQKKSSPNNSIYFKNLDKGKYIIEIYNTTKDDKYAIRHSNNTTDHLLVDITSYNNKTSDINPNRLLRLPRQRLSI